MKLKIGLKAKGTGPEMSAIAPGFNKVAGMIANVTNKKKIPVKKQNV